ncbi:nucleotide exchange factor SIL1 [Brachionus plicatilis]|uniref:Nucleotide exchange factor SIL1 n=1 Tax=Brachionus plicatilis TaxID=10195 RepID=A0A3M7P3T1_BRAPC|nr:nucleotide exchange factor SIL1 [Brachionus plicatilis]
MKFCVYLILFCVSLIRENLSNDLILVDDSSNVDKIDEKFEIIDEEFIPTHEWKRVKPGQAIPKGLHVRLNVQTGEREAKILEEEKPAISKEFEESLKRINNEQLIPEKSFGDVAHEDQIHKKFKSYDQLKKELNDINFNVQTDFEIIKNLLEQFKSSNRDQKIAILKDLEFYVHQFDNGLLLCDLGGFDSILNELNSTLLNQDSEYAQNLIIVLGSAVQSNPKVKVYAIKTQLLQIILNRMSTRVLTDELQSKFIFTLSGLLRNFPLAQNEFLKLGGVEILSNLMRIINSIKLKTKILTLTDDLIREKIAVMKDEHDEKVVRQYEQINLMGELIEKKWCDHFSGLLAVADDHDSIEKILASMMTLLNSCQVRLQSEELVKILKNHVDVYENLAKTEQDDDYFARIAKNIKTILNEVKSKQDL